MMDLVFLIATIALAVTIRTTNAIVVLLPTLFTYYYAYGSVLFDLHTGTMNHVTYGLIFISTAYYATPKLACIICIYCTLHFFMGLDYYLYPLDEYDQTLLSNVYGYIANFLNFCLIAAAIERNYDDDRNNRSVVPIVTRVVYLWNNHSHSQKGEKA